MATKENQCCETKFKTSCGGQALIEGIMMQGPDRRAVVVRKPDGELDVTTWDMPPRKAIWKKPFLRGLITFGSAMLHGVKALMYSAEVSGEMDVGDEELTGLDKWINDHFSDEKASALLITIAAVLGVAFSVALFILLPTALTGLVALVWKTMPLWVRAVFEGVFKVAIFLIYLGLVSHMKEIRRVFQYHGAEHKTIFCYENGLELTVENVRKQGRHHPRCGTSFIFVVLIVSIFLSIVIFTPLKIENTLLRMLFHLLLLPFIVCVTYEFNRYVGGNNNALCRILRKPGMALQNFTTFEPDDSMIEVAIEALKLVLPEEEGADHV